VLEFIRTALVTNTSVVLTGGPSEGLLGAGLLGMRTLLAMMPDCFRAAVVAQVLIAAAVDPVDAEERVASYGSLELEAQAKSEVNTK
jgi:hypothetical protein